MSPASPRYLSSPENKQHILDNEHPKDASLVQKNQLKVRSWCWKKINKQHIDATKNGFIAKISHEVP